MALNTGPALHTCQYSGASFGLLAVFTAHPKHAPSPHAIFCSNDISHGILCSLAKACTAFSIGNGPQANILSGVSFPQSFFSSFMAKPDIP